jgi:hypothetical protein
MLLPGVPAQELLLGYALPAVSQLLLQQHGLTSSWLLARPQRRAVSTSLQNLQAGPLPGRSLQLQQQGAANAASAAALALKKLGLKDVQHIVAVSSAKGGVGKSTVAGERMAQIVGGGVVLSVLSDTIQRLSSESRLRPLMSTIAASDVSGQIIQLSGCFLAEWEHR